MFNIGRHKEAVSINPLEFMLDSSNKALVFNTEADALNHLRSLGYKEDQLEHFFIVPSA